VIGSDLTSRLIDSTYTYIQILSVAISPFDDRIASGGDDGKLNVVDAITGDLKFSCDAHDKYWIRC
jgi:WD40 repeat protein